ncbi:MAG: methylated-DNA--[protein]-cysteine S-methyltransferase [Verrucomicrobia bacterium]|nr:methylated-DNA--[protein]-cysteine S-methyltransferase [Verrucomicrobiota bacterium]
MSLGRLIIPSPLGPLYLTSEGESLTSILYAPSFGTEEPTPFLRKVAEELSRYFKGDLIEFSFPFKFNKGTPFQQKVWLHLLSIPYGKTMSYSDFANSLGTALRPTASALGKNPLAILLACHRVIGKNGALTGYNGGLDKKQHLLELEKHVIQSALAC